MIITNYPHIDEKMIYEKLDNGLEVYLIPKKEYDQTCAVFTTKFGGLNHGYEIEVNGEKEKVLWQAFKCAKVVFSIEGISPITSSL